MKAALVLALVSIPALFSVPIRAEEKNPAEVLVRLKAAKVADGELTGETERTVVVLVPVLKTVLIDGKAVTITENIPQQKTEIAKVTYSLKGAKATQQGKEIAAADLAAAVKEAKAVIVFPTSAKPTEKELKAMPKETVVIELLEKK